MLQILAAKMGLARRLKNRDEEQQELGFEQGC
jgi:hypothetical protein